jgi:hypothetical protein
MLDSQAFIENKDAQYPNPSGRGHCPGTTSCARQGLARCRREPLILS